MGLGGVLLLSVLCSCVHSLVLDYNTIRGSAEVDLRTETVRPGTERWGSGLESRGLPGEEDACRGSYR
ncbi:hypothetical protein EOD39_17702 [Acipenser ruthenus]|uniref:Uncharacterized protein n=1 Tax=Acipenser ruthenus TaxID=7906 RepID=A0A444V2S2_ACIRT|nr:hypothetical protein EOD39_17702 [Acipenser ruthenus]